MIEWMQIKGFLSFILLLLCDANRANLYTRATEIIYFLVFRDFSWHKPTKKFLWAYE